MRNMSGFPRVLLIIGFAVVIAFMLYSGFVLRWRIWLWKPGSYRFPYYTPGMSKGLLWLMRLFVVGLVVTIAFSVACVIIFLGGGDASLGKAGLVFMLIGCATGVLEVYCQRKNRKTAQALPREVWLLNMISEFYLPLLLISVGLALLFV